MMKKTTYIMISLAVAMFAAAGCAKQEAGTEGPASLMSIEPVVEGTKATLINDVAALQAQEEGFGLSVYNGDTRVYSNLKMKYSSGSWAPESGGPLKWPAGTAYKFYAWSPASLMTEDGSSKFTYSGIADQKDIMLGFYSGIGNISGNTCSAPIKFSHPLASVQFQVGTMTGLSKINSIKLSGVRPQGTCTVTPATPPIYSWSISNETAVVELSQTKEVSTFTTGTPIGDPFLVLPQPLNTDNITVTLNVTPTSGSAKDITFTITSAGSQTYHQTGKTTVYKINYDGQNVSLTVDIDDWTSGQSGTVEIEDGAIVIDVQNDYATFKANVESSSFDGYKNKTIIFENIGDWEESYSINDTYGNLEGATLDFQGANVTPEATYSATSGSGFGYLFSTLSSSNLIIENLIFQSKSFSFTNMAPYSTLVGTYDPNSDGELAFCNCHVLSANCTGSLQVSTQFFGAFVGRAAGGDINFNSCSVEISGSMSCIMCGGFIGLLSGSQNISFDDCSVSGGSIGCPIYNPETLTTYATGLFIGFNPLEAHITISNSFANNITLYYIGGNYSHAGLHSIPLGGSSTITVENYVETSITCTPSTSPHIPIK